MFQTNLDPFNLNYPPIPHPCQMKSVNQVETTAGNGLVNDLCQSISSWNVHALWYPSLSPVFK
jgi:hypothetical protein